MTLRSLFGLRSSKKEGGRDPGASASSSSPAEALAPKILAELAGLDHRAIGLHARRKHGAKLATLLNDVHGEQETRTVLAVLAKANLAFRLLAVLDEYDEDHSGPDDDRSDEGNDADLVLCKSMLSCLASYAYLGGALQIQAAGGVMHLLRFMSHDDATARAYACAAMQNATVFLELLDVKSLGSDELNELTRLCEHKDASIAEPARLVRANLEHDRRFQEGSVDVHKVAAELEELGEKEHASPAPVRAKPGDRWWEEAQTLQALVLKAPATPELEEVEVVLRLGASGYGSGYGLVLQSAAHVKTRSIRRVATLQKAASALIKFLAQKKAAEAAAAAAAAPAPEPSAPAVVPVDRSEVSEMKVGALREALAQRGLSIEGKRKELQERLLEALEATPTAPPPGKDGAAGVGAGAPRAGVAVGAGAVAARVIQQKGAAAAAAPAPEPSVPAVVPVDRSEVSEMKVGALREALAQRGLSIEGKRKELQERLLEALDAELAALADTPADAPVDAPAAAPAEAPPAPKASPVLVTAVDPLSLNSALVVRGDEVLEVDGVDVRGNLAQASMRFQEHAGLQPNVPLRLRLLRRRHGHPLLPATNEAHQHDPWKTIHATLAMLDEQVLRVVDPKQLDLQPTPMPTPQPTPKPSCPTTGGGAGAVPAQVLARVLQEVTPDLGATAAAASAAATAATAGEGAVADDEPALAPAHPLTNRTPAAVAARRLGEPLVLNGLSLSAQAAQRLVDRAWERMLVLKLKLKLADGQMVELTGRQVVGLHTAAEASAEKQIAIVHAGVRVLLTAHALGVLKQRLEAKSLAAVDPALISAPDAVLAARLSREEDGRTRTTEAADPQSRAAAVETEAAEAVECTFVFLDAARLRRAELKSLPSFREIMLNHPDWHVERTLSIDDASAEPSALRSILAVSHRREMDEVPDPTGAKLAAIQRHLERHPEIELVWYDHSCLPSDNTIQDYESHESLVAPKLPGNQRIELRRMRDAMRECACLPFLCASCLLLVDGGYCARFWTQLEAWLSLQRATPAGFVDERTRARCTIELLPNEPEFLRTLLAEVLAAKTATQACEMLRSPRVPVGHSEDKHEQLAKLERLDAWLRGTVRRRVPALVPSVVGDAHAPSAAEDATAGQALHIV